MYTGTRPGVSSAIRAGKGWRGRRELAPRCFCHPIRCIRRRRVWRDTHAVLNSPYHHQQAQTGCALLFFVGNRCAWLILAGDHLRVVSPSDAESGGCVRGIVTNSRPSAWPLPRSRTTQLYGDRRRQGPGRRGTRSTTRYDDRSPLLPSRSSSVSKKSPAGPASTSV